MWPTGLSFPNIVYFPPLFFIHRVVSDAFDYKPDKQENLLENLKLKTLDRKNMTTNSRSSRHIVRILEAKMYGWMCVCNKVTPVTDGLTNPHPWRERCRAGYSNTDWSSLPQTRAPFWKRSPLTALPMERGRVNWAKGKGPSNWPIFPYPQGKWARVTTVDCVLPLLWQVPRPTLFWTAKCELVDHCD